MKQKPPPEKTALILSPECTVAMLEVFAQDPLLIETVVQNPSCPPQVLERFSNYSRGIGRLIVQNPNTPKRLLFELGEKHPREFLQNPILLLATLEDPAFWSSAPEDFLEKILRRPDAPFDMICQSLLTNLLSHHDGLLLMIAKHPDAPEQALLQLGGCWQAHVRWKASKHPKFPKELVEVAQAELLRGALTDEVFQAKLYQEEVPVLTPDVLSLCARGGPWLRYVAASDRNTPREILEELAFDTEFQVFGAAAENPSQTPETLHRFSAAYHLHSATAKNPSASPETLRVLWEVAPKIHVTLLNLAQNPSSPEDVLRALYQENHQYWQGLAQNPSCPKDLLQFFEDDSQRALFEYLALNPALSEASLSILAESLNHKTRRNAAKNPSLPKECLEALAQDPNKEVRMQVAARLDLPKELQVLLAVDKEKLVQKALFRSKERRNREM
jgi:hypothetical protein